MTARDDDGWPDRIEQPSLGASRPPASERCNHL